MAGRAVVGDSSDTQGRANVHPPRLVGREVETGELAAALARPGALVLVEGEAGIGKSRLVREFLGSAAGGSHKALIAACPPVRQPFTLGPLSYGCLGPTLFALSGSQPRRPTLMRRYAKTSLCGHWDRWFR